VTLPGAVTDQVDFGSAGRLWVKVIGSKT